HSKEWPFVCSPHTHTRSEDRHMPSLSKGFDGARRAVSAVLVAVVTPLLEKNPVKIASFAHPLVFSMARLIVLAFAVGVLHEMWYAGVAGWPEATLAIA